MMTTLTQLRLRYTAPDITHRERADIEAKVWEIAPPEQRATRVPDARERYVAEVLGAKMQEVRIRFRLTAHRSKAGPLWDRIDQDLPLRTAYTILKRSRTARDVRDNLAAWTAAPLKARMPDGKVSRRWPPGASAGERPAADPASAPDHPAPPTPASAPPTHGRSFWHSLRKSLDQALAERLAGLDAATVARERARFEAEIKAAFEGLQNRLNRLRTQRPGGTADVISRRRLASAFRDLHLDPPRAGKPLPLKQAQKQFKALVAEYHPDRSGTEATRPMYQRVLDAWSTIQQYADLCGTAE